jgi:hypothetical protein
VAAIVARRSTSPVTEPSARSTANKVTDGVAEGRKALHALTLGQREVQLPQRCSQGRGVAESLGRGKVVVGAPGEGCIQAVHKQLPKNLSRKGVVPIRG